MNKNRRKYDVTSKEIHDILWNKWMLESVLFFNHKDNDVPEVPEEEEEAADITYYQVLMEVA